VARFKLNRRWAFILALGASLVCCSIGSRNVVAQTGGSVINDPSDPGFGPPAAGDPDLPSGPGAKTVKPGTLKRNSGGHGIRTAGDGMGPRIAWMWRLRIVRMSLRGVYFRF